MSTDKFTDDARAEARRQAQEWLYDGGRIPTLPETSIAGGSAWGFLAGAVWGRDYIANQEVTDSEVEAVERAVHRALKSLVGRLDWAEDDTAIGAQAARIAEVVRAVLAEQEPTDSEIDAAKLALEGLSLTAFDGHLPGLSEHAARKALTAAKKVIL